VSIRPLPSSSITGHGAGSGEFGCFFARWARMEEYVLKVMGHPSTPQVKEKFGSQEWASKECLRYTFQAGQRKEQD